MNVVTKYVCNRYPEHSGASIVQKTDCLENLKDLFCVDAFLLIDNRPFPGLDEYFCALKEEFSELKRCRIEDFSVERLEKNKYQLEITALQTIKEYHFEVKETGVLEVENGKILRLESPKGMPLRGSGQTQKNVYWWA